MYTSRTPVAGPRGQTANLVVLGCLAAIAPTVVIVVVARAAVDGNFGYTVLRLLLPALLVATTASAMLVKKLWTYYLLLAAQQLSIIGFVALFVRVPIAHTLALTFVIIELSYIEPYPRSMLISLAVLAGSVFIVAIDALLREKAASDWLTLIGPPVPLAALALLLPRVTLYRENVAQLTHEREHLGDSVVSLTRANSEYQNYAVVATERAEEQERLRVTREIHDIVGYTLTNNIMLMEAALRLMHENVLALPSIIETARENAKEGLASIRAALYKLRSAELAYPAGVKAISRMVRTFEQATMVEVRCEFGNAPWTISEQVDAGLYHLVQECLVNSYRHGKAKHIRIMFYRQNDRVEVDIDDDGVGAADYTEGIGLKGMSERMAAVGGSVSVVARPGRFTVHASVPVGRAIYE